MLSILAFLSLSAFAGSDAQPNPQFNYQAQVIAGELDCATEAAAWAQRFSDATGAQVLSASCRSEQTLNADQSTYRVYNLGLSYSAQAPYHPYTVMLGKKDPLDSNRLYENPIYPTMDLCRSDVPGQTRLYEEQTGLRAVTSTCVADASYTAPARYFLKIEGFNRNQDFGFSRPQKYLYTFAPYAFENLEASRQARAEEFILSYGATIVKQSPGIFIYYRAEGPIPAKAESIAYNRNQAECEAQLNIAIDLFTKAGSEKVFAWCEGNRLQALHDGYFSLYQMTNQNSIQYATFEQCVADKEFVLSDARNSGALGALCAPGLYNMSSYEMILYRKGL